MVKDLFKKIKVLREENSFSQEYLARELGMSRPTYMLIEQGERELTITEAEKLAAIFDMSLENFLVGKDGRLPAVSIKKRKISRKAKELAIRISIPQEKAEKFKQVLLYIIAKIGGKPNIGQTVLYKLLYFIDFDYYEKFEEQLVGAKYIKNYYGPTPVMFTKIMGDLEHKGKVEKIKSKFYKHEQTKYLVNPNEQLDLSELSAQELAHIDWELDRLGDLTATQISALSHIDTPWKVAKKREALEYEHVFYRPEETSVKDYETL
ncbi:MAG: XRE family transcriptional regulator [Parcubacteria group bacterium]|jgi:transcriptional regulator with XRE-family HTH domain|nr:XRE family transcriptional regulator [Parcubacteria group bacterium]|tara:strand:- start:9389 stop:10180 length:792 start_codon:yes stop_codon:yes gene_type:complete